MEGGRVGGQEGENEGEGEGGREGGGRREKKGGGGRKGGGERGRDREFKSAREQSLVPQRKCPGLWSYFIREPEPRPVVGVGSDLTDLGQVGSLSPPHLMFSSDLSLNAALLLPPTS